MRGEKALLGNGFFGIWGKDLFVKLDAREVATVIPNAAFLEVCVNGEVPSNGDDQPLELDLSHGVVTAEISANDRFPANLTLETFVTLQSKNLGETFVTIRPVKGGTVKFVHGVKFKRRGPGERKARVLPETPPLLVGQATREDARITAVTSLVLEDLNPGVSFKRRRWTTFDGAFEEVELGVVPGLAYRARKIFGVTTLRESNTPQASLARKVLAQQRMSHELVRQTHVSLWEQAWAERPVAKDDPPLQELLDRAWLVLLALHDRVSPRRHQR
ncbi:MAG: hypothetical protein Kow0069_32890 [Promethearchaeota archaeon]